MTSVFSSIDLQTRMEVQDLLSRFCQTLDYGQSAEWADLFTPDARVVAPRLGVFSGREELMKIPLMVTDLGKGAWRHVLANVVLNRSTSIKAIDVTAYVMVHDWKNSGTTARCWDFSAHLAKSRSWRIHRLEMRPVADSRPPIYAGNDDQNATHAIDATP